MVYCNELKSISIFDNGHLDIELYCSSSFPKLSIVSLPIASKISSNASRSDIICRGKFEYRKFEETWTIEFQIDKLMIDDSSVE